MTQNTDPVSAPLDREKAVSAAFLRLLGSTQADAASAAGVSRASLGRWEASSWWPEVQAEASARWLSGLAARARRGLEAGVETDGRLALQVLERLVPELQPPRARLDVRAGPIEEMTDAELYEIIRSGR